MPPTRRRKTHNTTNDTLAILNGINERGANRRHTTGVATVNEASPTSPEPVLRSRLRNRNPNPSTTAASQSEEAHETSASHDNLANNSLQTDQERNPQNGDEDIEISDYDWVEAAEYKETNEYLDKEEETEDKEGEGEEEEEEDESTRLNREDSGLFVTDTDNFEHNAADQSSSVLQRPPIDSQPEPEEVNNEVQPTSIMLQGSSHSPEPPFLGRDLGYGALIEEMRQANTAQTETVEVVVTHGDRDQSSKVNTKYFSKNYFDEPNIESDMEHSQIANVGYNGASSLPAHDDPRQYFPEPSPSAACVQIPQYLSELDSWFSAEVDEGSFEKEWKFLRDFGRGLALRFSEPVPKTLQSAYELIMELQQLQLRPTGSEADLIQEIQNLSEAIYVEIRQVLDFPALINSNAGAAGYLVFQVEGYLIPELVILIQLSFRCYRRSGDLAYDPLHSSLGLLSKCCKHIYNLWNCGYISLNKRRPKSLMLQLHLRRLIEALENGALVNKPVEGATSIPETSLLFQDRWTVPWSGDEENYLVIGLQRYKGSNRYVSIKRHMGHYLPQRTVSELKSKAQALRQLLGASYPDQSSMPSWLASV